MSGRRQGGEEAPSWVIYATDPKATPEQRVARVLHERAPAWWNSLTDHQRRYYKRDSVAGQTAAFEAGIRAGIEVGAALATRPQPEER